MVHAHTRRGLVGAIPALVVAISTAPALASGILPDAELLALRDEWTSTIAGLALYGSSHTAAEDALADARSLDPSRSREDVAKAVGLNVAEAEWNAAVDANAEILDQIAATPARTLEGLVFKAKACAKADYYRDLANAIIDDLVAMGGAHA